MTGELLRRAAAAMRERAEAARIGPWVADAEADMWHNPIVCGPEYPAEEDGHTHRFVIAECHGFSKPQNAAHIASWHPAVALAVADWLEHQAAVHESLIKLGARGLRTDGQTPNALTVAAAYLGEDQP